MYQHTCLHIIYIHVYTIKNASFYLLLCPVFELLQIVMRVRVPNWLSLSSLFIHSKCMTFCINSMLTRFRPQSQSINQSIDQTLLGGGLEN